jgi:hypothetical protein
MPLSKVPAAALAANAARGNFGAGAVLQVVNAVMPNARVNTTSTSYIDTGLSASITPSSATSKILVIVQHTGLARSSGGNGYIDLILLRNSTSIMQIETQAGYASDDANSERSVAGTGTNYLDSPATTSSVTYKTQFKTSGGSQVFIERQAGITLMEIAG